MFSGCVCLLLLDFVAIELSFDETKYLFRNQFISSVTSKPCSSLYRSSLNFAITSALVRTISAPVFKSLIWILSLTEEATD